MIITSVFADVAIFETNDQDESISQQYVIKMIISLK